LSELQSIIAVTVEDEAPVFDPTSRPEPDMSVSPLVRGPRGMGIHLMRLATDAIATGLSSSLLDPDRTAHRFSVLVDQRKSSRA
jgi:hypothetical protein